MAHILVVNDRREFLTFALDDLLTAVRMMLET
jgi:hypothetical protein